MPRLWTHRLSDPWPTDRADPVAELGGKGAGLVRLIRAGFPVPPGFVIRAEACAEFLARGGRWPEGLRDEVKQELTHLSSATYAVRGGAAVSMPGILETKLDVHAADVNEAVRTVFISWQSDRAVRYRSAHHLHSLPGTAVVVQEMIPCDVSGVLFTRDPTGATDESVVEVVRGSGRAIVSGEVTPEQYRLGRDDGMVTPSAGTSLTREQVSVLFALALRVEELFRQPVDIEWGYSRGRFELFQARPIRSLELRAAAEQLLMNEIARLKELSRDERTLWVSHNLGETVVHPTPLEWSLWHRFMSGTGGLGSLYRGLGYRPPIGGFLELVAGRVYADPQREAEFSGFGLPVTLDIDAIAKNPESNTFAIDRAKTGLGMVLKLPAALWRLWRVNRRTAESAARTIARFDTAQAGIESWFAAERGRPLSGLSADELLSVLDARRRRVFDDFGPEVVRPGFFCGLALRRTNDANQPDVKALLMTRETAGGAFKRGIDLIWQAVDELDRRWSAGGGLRFLTVEELPTYPEDRTKWDAVIAERRLMCDAGRLIQLPPVIDSRMLDDLGHEPAVPVSADVMVGTPLSSGIAGGTVWVRNDGDPPPGSVVVAETADPALSAFFPVVAALVVERGGVLSHLAVLAREAGVPAVAFTDARRLFKDGDTIRVNGTAGRIDRITPRTPA